MKYPTLIFLTLFFCTFSVHALDWEKVKVMRTIDTEHALLANGKVIRFIGFDGPNHLFPSLQERGIARRTYHFMKALLDNKTIQILVDVVFEDQNLFPRHVKLESGQNLVELLLQKGFVVLHSDRKETKFDTKYQKAEAIAREKNIGIWDKSESEKNRDLIIKTAGVMTTNWKKKYAHLLAPISSGRVIAVPSGNTLTLENGACVRLLGVITPSPFDPRKGYQCFGQQSQKHLTSLVLGKRVEFTKDMSQLDEDYSLLRHIWIPSDVKSMSPPVHVNQEMIKNGYGKTVFPPEDEKFQERFLFLQNQVYQDPVGAWYACAAKLLTPQEKASKPIDPNCPIKVSRSGKIHTPKSGWYQRLTPIQCFDTVKEATTAGFQI